MDFDPNSFPQSDHIFVNLRSIDKIKYPLLVTVLSSQRLGPSGLCLLSNEHHLTVIAEGIR